MLRRQLADKHAKIDGVVAKLESTPRTESEAVAKLEQQLKAARTRNKNLTAEVRAALMQRSMCISTDRPFPACERRPRE